MNLCMEFCMELVRILYGYLFGGFRGDVVRFF